MKRCTGIVLLGVTVITVLLLLFGDESYSNMKALERSARLQRQRNENLQAYVNDLRGIVRGLRHDDRSIELAARNELGMARPDEIIFFFEESEESGTDIERQTRR